jgi:hypothetical protein
MRKEIRNLHKIEMGHKTSKTVKFMSRLVTRLFMRIVFGSSFIAKKKTILRKTKRRFLSKWIYLEKIGKKSFRDFEFCFDNKMLFFYEFCTFLETRYCKNGNITGCSRHILLPKNKSHFAPKICKHTVNFFLCYCIYR